MKISYLPLVAFFLSGPSFAMLVVPQALMKANKVCSLSHVSKRRLVDNKLNCKCIHHFDDSLKQTADLGEFIDNRVDAFQNAAILIQKKAELRLSDLWPEEYGKALEKEVQSIRYCPQFNCCAAKCYYRKALQDFARMVAVPASIGISIPIVFSTPGAALAVPIIFSGFVFTFNFKGRYEKYENILAYLSYRDMLTFNPIYTQFMNEYQKKQKQLRQQYSDEGLKEVYDLLEQTGQRVPSIEEIKKQRDDIKE